MAKLHSHVLSRSAAPQPQGGPAFHIYAAAVRATFDKRPKGQWAWNEAADWEQLPMDLHNTNSIWLAEVTINTELANKSPSAEKIRRPGPAGDDHEKLLAFRCTWQTMAECKRSGQVHDQVKWQPTFMFKQNNVN